jgi:branched-subunit amino acid transport protein AzlD
MVASNDEINKIVNILGQYFPDSMIEMMLEEVWEEVGVTTSNKSLRDTIAGMLSVVKVYWTTGEEQPIEKKTCCRNGCEKCEQ